MVLTAAAVAASMCLGAAGLIAGIAPFRGRSMPTPASHDVPVFLWLGPLVLGMAGVILGLFPGLVVSADRIGGYRGHGSGFQHHVGSLAWLHHHARAQRA